ncbi:GMC family oxidoreductase N-terminal domain-containing protein [Mycobacterium intracellulare]|uniref:GMC family oxidoreductase N-terminal domain-containing protein n=1 Tax=Mycobacterium intracellulare TaxID=1767 RepID=A0AAE4R8M7_MYCIT|nr:GMC family oxidoreductase N-terminal domain-containing protein [Mycobacterium intracellulare]MCA2318580.1 GMC family oxidoreductase N-terminal domain-containing protein [Mycobacterium intracellulare]MCA2339116.1 GMC family oxidoreductase N-terminal domain-containing protein [Mycobacterium intracellulare]MDV6975572.1 GMC family oxidoreductase N-terminal domain-containing protein [Mycobacterium intracellulare]MDV6980636.1 GMC family oxidoreductase N-terminal domain-containing protein [Mycobact
MLPSEIAPHYDFVVCGSGSSGSVVAGRIAENPYVTVLLVEAGDTDNVPAVQDPSQWPLNLGSERDWGFVSQPIAHLNGRSISLSMGKVLGGGSSINVMAWARGHRSDWDYFAAEAGDESWGYQSVLEIYRRIEDWHGPADPDRGAGGPVFVAPGSEPNPLAAAIIEGARSVGIPSYPSNNSAMMVAGGGASLIDLRVRNGFRQSMFGSYVRPLLRRSNLTILTGATLTRLISEANRVTAVEFSCRGTNHSVAATSEVVVSLGAINTPKVLMQSGIGDADELRQFGIPLVSHLPGVGHNYQDHPRIDCVWEYRQPLEPRNNGAEAMVLWKSDALLEAPDLQICVAELPLSSAENAAVYGLPEHGWTACVGVLRPKSRGRVRLTGPNPAHPVAIEDNRLAHDEDFKAALAAVELCREIGNSVPVERFNKREVMPGNLAGQQLERFIRDGTETFWHQSGTAKMGRDAMSVVDGTLKVYGVDGLRIADGSIMPRITAGNTMAPCVVIGERAGDLLKAEHGL